MYSYSTHKEAVALTGAALVATGERMVPRTVAIGLRRTPILERTKTICYS